MQRQLNGIIIAIDGHSSCGKSTLARLLAKALGYTYIDTGAMYRAVTLYFLDVGIPPDDPEAVQKALREIRIGFRPAGEQQETFLNGQNVERDIRTLRVSRAVSELSAISEVRRAMVAEQREMGEGGAVVMDGRDIGTVVFPAAELKLFMTATLEVRARRRYEELVGKGIPADHGEVIRNLEERDRIDSGRADSPLRRANDAITLDSTVMTVEEELEAALRLAKERGA